MLALLVAMLLLLLQAPTQKFSLTAANVWRALRAGKSLTVHELVRQCHRHAAAAPAEAAGSSSHQAQQGQQQLPPALLSINCMSLSDPQQVR